MMSLLERATRENNDYISGLIYFFSSVVAHKINTERFARKNMAHASTYLEGADNKKYEGVI